MNGTRTTRVARVGVTVLASTLWLAPSVAAGEREAGRITESTGRQPGGPTPGVIPPGGSIVPVTGYGDDRLQPVLDALVDFMRHRCIGAATIGISYKGIPLGEWGLGRMHGRATQDVVDPACGDDTTDPFDPTAAVVDHRTPMRIGSVSKGITAAVTRWAVKEVYTQQTGETLTDDELEDLRIFGDDFPVPLLSERLRELYRGEVPLGELPACDATDDAVDPRWQEVTLGHLLGHRAGIPGGLEDETEVVPYLPYLRGLNGADDLQAEHDAVRAAAPDVGAFDAAHVSLQGVAEGGVYFLARQTMEERLAVRAGRCLSDTFGTYDYSNDGPQFLGAVSRHLTASDRFSADVGDPDSHEGSALDLFFEDQIGLHTYGNRGAFQAQTVEGLPADSYTTPRSRDWNAGQGTYHPTAYDAKHPHCRFDGERCDWDEWKDGPRASWLYGLDPVPTERSGVGIGAPQGGLNVETRFMLEFLSRFWIGGYDSAGAPESFDPRIGEPRNGVWDRHTQHSGKLSSGGQAWAVQFGGTSRSFSRPPVGPDGHLLDDIVNLVDFNVTLPAGLDVFVAVNQSTDPKCQAADSCPYSILEDVVAYGLSQVDWPELTSPLDAARGGTTVVVPAGPQVVTG